MHTRREARVGERLLAALCEISDWQPPRWVRCSFCVSSAARWMAKYLPNKISSRRALHSRLLRLSTDTLFDSCFKTNAKVEGTQEPQRARDVDIWLHLILCLVKKHTLAVIWIYSAAHTWWANKFNEIGNQLTRCCLCDSDTIIFRSSSPLAASAVCFRFLREASHSQLSCQSNWASWLPLGAVCLFFSLKSPLAIERGENSVWACKFLYREASSRVFHSILSEAIARGGLIY